MEFVNLTPHVVRIYPENGAAPREIPASGMVTRIAEAIVKTPSIDRAPSIDGVPFTLIELGEVLDLPAPKAATIYIVSMPTLMALKALDLGREDCLYPYGQVRDDEGRICGCRGLAIII